jgi:hypothetical protein
MILFICIGLTLKGQMINHYWTQNFNSTSSLIGGAVVAGDGDNSSIYYNPAAIVEMQKGSNVSVAANLFVWNVYNNYNSLGTGNNLDNTNFQVQPQFASYSYKPPKGNISIAASILTRMKEDLETDFAKSTEYDVLTNVPGDEIYNTSFTYRNKYVDTWIGFGFGHQLQHGFSYGATLFVSASTLIYHMGYGASAFKYADTVINGENPGIVSTSNYFEALQFYQYRLISKIGMAYQLNNWRFGLVFTLPSINVFTSGRQAFRTELQINIHDTIFSSAEKSIKGKFQISLCCCLWLYWHFQAG